MKNPSTGMVPPDEFKKAISLPYGEATRLIRKYEPTFGLNKLDEVTKKYRVSVNKTITATAKAVVTVDAADEENARKQVDDMDWDNFDWSYPSEDYREHEIDDVEDVK